MIHRGLANNHGVTLAWRQDTTLFRAIEHLLEVDCGIETLGWVLAVVDLLAARHRLSSPLLDHRIILVGSRARSCSVPNGLGSDLDESWL